MTHRVVVLLLLVFTFVNAKIYKKCELAKELKYVHDIDAKEIPIWVCIAKHESDFNTSAVNRGSGDHGLFQISDIYWCSLEGQGRACYSSCSSFEDDDISDDVQCIRRIFNEHRRISGNGFDAWVVYPLYCKGDTGRYVEGCFDQSDLSSTTGKPIVTTTDGDEDEYEFPPLPVFPKFQIVSAKPFQNQIIQEIVTKKSENSPKVTLLPPFSPFTLFGSSSLRPPSSEGLQEIAVTSNNEEYSFPPLPVFSSLGYYAISESTMKPVFSSTLVNEFNDIRFKTSLFPKRISSTQTTSKSITQDLFSRNSFKLESTTAVTQPPSIQTASQKSATSKSLHINNPTKIFLTKPKSLFAKKDEDSDDVASKRGNIVETKSSFFNFSPDRTKTQEKTIERINLGKDYIFERNFRGGFKLRLQ